MPTKASTHKPYKQQEGKARERAGKYSHLYRTPRWRAIRKSQLQIEPLCRLCYKNGIVKLANICDHIEPHRGNMVKFWNGPFQSLCKHCHDSYKQAFEKSGKQYRKIGVDGYPI